MGDWVRTGGSGELRPADAGRDVTLMGWVARRREHGGVTFVDLRDRSGVVQVVLAGELSGRAGDLRVESVVAVRGTVGLRPEGLSNPALPTGEVEVRALDFRVLNPARTPPIYTDDAPGRVPVSEAGRTVDGAEPGETGEVLRLRYRYLDLRRPRMQRNLALRHRMVKAVRDYLDELGFLEIETPNLTRSTPEGARDYLVPARNAPGRFYALPQSPQLFKQLLMVAGFERYFQIARCFRDEDLRADRQPEFTQIDVEMSFVTPADVLQLTEGLMVRVWREAAGVEIKAPFPRMDYDEAVLRYGTDKPDLRFGLEISDVTELVGGSEFRVFGEAAARGEVVRGLAVPGGAGLLSRKDLDGLTEQVKAMGAPGLVWMAFEAAGVRSPVAKHLSSDVAETLRRALGAQEGAMALFVAGPSDAAAAALGHLRLEMAGKLGLTRPGDLRFLWVVNYPLFEAGDTPERLAAKHHPFTAPVASDLPLLETQPARVRARAYDLVLNGTELGGGSIRNHVRDVQERVFRAMGVPEEEVRAKFGFLLDALEYGAPPHGGIALGVDRIAAMLAGEDSIREVIAFPKTASAACPMTQAPAPVDPGQLEELGVRVDAGPERVG
ncbi:MAG: aspartate--tRNA ligase [Bacillota bacterium]|nr:MAG: aspartate--tRNA ligase [Bacillota bacterium]